MVEVEDKAKAEDEAKDEDEAKVLIMMLFVFYCFMYNI